MKFAYTILYVHDVAKSLAFYESAFGFKRRFLHESGTYGELKTGATTLSFASHEIAKANLPKGVQRNNPKRPPIAAEVAFSTKDVAAAFKQALSTGAVSLAKPKKKQWGQTVAWVRDPDGHLIEICTPMS